MEMKMKQINAKIEVIQFLMEEVENHERIEWGQWKH
jgi:hypothetical protein